MTPDLNPVPSPGHRAAASLAKRLRALADSIDSALERDDPYLNSVYFDPWLAGELAGTFHDEAKKVGSRLALAERREAKARHPGGTP